MRPYLIILFLLVAAAGCDSSSKNNPGSLAVSPADTNSPADVNFPADVNAPADVNSLEDAVFEIEEELVQKQVAVSDPIEPFNRTMFNINDGFYFCLAKPVMQGYEKIVPKPARIGISNFFQNLTTPVRLVNCLLQGKNPQAGTELHRFCVNTTAGVLGFGDPARDKLHLEPAQEDLGQTLAVHGHGNGCYIVWPLLGPSTLRDSVGMAGDWFLDPVTYVKPTEVYVGIWTEDYVNDGSFHIGEYEAFKKASVDPYVAMRNVYIQYREKQIHDQPAEPNTYKP